MLRGVLSFIEVVTRQHGHCGQDKDTAGRAEKQWVGVRGVLSCREALWGALGVPSDPASHEELGEAGDGGRPRGPSGCS